MFKVEPHEPQGAYWWFQRIRQGAVDLKPSYQRLGKLWNPYKKALLIDSMINGFDIPKLYFADFRSSDVHLSGGNSPYAVIDGKQRLEAICEFFKGDIPLAKGSRSRDEETRDLSGMTYLQLKSIYPLLAERIETYKLAVMSVTTDELGLVEEMFVRLNSGEATTGAERRNAMLGIVPDLIRKTASHDFFEDCVPFSKARLEHFNVAAKLLLIEYRGGFADTKASNLDKFVKDAIGSADLPYLEAFARCKETLDKLSLVFMDSDPVLNRSGEIPVYFWLARERGQIGQSFRSVLSDFRKALAKNREVEMLNPEAANPELSLYYTLSRSTNDKASLEGRYQILSKRYAAASSRP